MKIRRHLDSMRVEMGSTDNTTAYDVSRMGLIGFNWV